MAALFDFSKQNKDFISNVTVGFLPRKVLIPLSQESDFICNSIVKEGDTVKQGQVIAEVSREVYGTSSFGVSKIHSSIPGKVLGIKSCTYPNGKQGNAVEILLNGSFSHTGKIENFSFDWKNYSPSLLLRSISDAGVVNTFSTFDCSSLELDINKLRDFENKKLFVRLFDEDYSFKTDSILARSNFEKIMTGIFVTAKTLEAKEIIIAYSINDLLEQIQLNEKNELILSEDQKELFANFKLSFLPISAKSTLPSKKRQLVNAYFKANKIFSSNKKFANNCLFSDSNTMLNVYNAVVLNNPVEFVNVFVKGDCLAATSLLKIPIGTSFKLIARQCGGFIKKLGRIIVNGELTGIAINSLETPVTKYVKSIEFTSTKDSFDRSFGMCVHCGKCRQQCKINLCPDLVYSKMIFGATIDKVYIDSVEYCAECGECSSVCPSKLPLVQVMKLLKMEK